MVTSECTPGLLQLCLAHRPSPLLVRASPSHPSTSFCKLAFSAQLNSPSRLSHATLSCDGPNQQAPPRRGDFRRTTFSKPRRTKPAPSSDHIQLQHDGVTVSDGDATRRWSPRGGLALHNNWTAASVTAADSLHPLVPSGSTHTMSEAARIQRVKRGDASTRYWRWRWAALLS